MLKPVRRDQTVAVISTQDDAIDIERSDKWEGDGGLLQYHVDRYTDPSSWRTTVKLKDGEQPTVFELGIIPSSELVRIEDECGAWRDGEVATRQRELFWRCFVAGLRDVHTLDGECPKVDVDGVSYVKPQWIRETFVGHLRSIAIEIGGIAWRWNSLRPDDIKK